MEKLQQRDWLIAIHGIDGIGRRSLRALHELTGEDFSEIRLLDMETLKLHTKLKPSAMEQLLAVDESYAASIKHELQQKRVSCITLLDDDYPELLKEAPDAPWVLYCRGDMSLLSRFSLTFVGTRQPTSYGRAVTTKLVSALAAGGCTIVSGMARGIDSLAHEAALQVGGTTIAVLGCGIDVIYPPENAQLYSRIVTHGLVISEYAPGMQPHPGMFPERNRILSGLAHGTVVIEANARSGSLITADQAMEQGRDVFAVPGPITSPRSEGPNALIQQGAKLVMRVQDILEEYPALNLASAWEEAASAVELSDLEKKCLRLLAHEPLHLEQLIQTLGEAAQSIQAMLLSLQLKKQISQLPGQMYRRT